MTTTNPLDVQKKETTQTQNIERTRDRRVFSPLADIFETDREIIIVADVPGSDENSIDITLDKNVLTINAYVEPDKHEKHTLTYAEFAIGDYQRSFVLSNQIDRNGIEATVKNGVLYLHLPKAAEAQARKITVRAA
jgi:HSP20 family molecular chaperone IbpA